MSQAPSHPGLAAVLSFVIPGLGQIYNGHFLRATFWLVIAFWVIDQPMDWPMHASVWHWAVHFLPALTAFGKARQIELVRAWKRDMERKTSDSNGGRIIDQ